jgi:hypothetical protein
MCKQDSDEVAFSHYPTSAGAINSVVEKKSRFFRKERIRAIASRRPPIFPLLAPQGEAPFARRIEQRAHISCHKYRVSRQPASLECPRAVFVAQKPDLPQD